MLQDRTRFVKHWIVELVIIGAYWSIDYSVGIVSNHKYIIKTNVNYDLNNSDSFALIVDQSIPRVCTVFTNRTVVYFDFVDGIFRVRVVDAVGTVRKRRAIEVDKSLILFI